MPQEPDAEPEPRTVQPSEVWDQLDQQTKDKVTKLLARMAYKYVLSQRRATEDTPADTNNEPPVVRGRVRHSRRATSPVTVEDCPFCHESHKHQIPKAPAADRALTPAPCGLGYYLIELQP